MRLGAITAMSPYKLVGAAVAALGTLAVLAAMGPAPAWASCGAPANEIERENCLPGTSPSIWDIPGSGSPTIQGFATDISVDLGERVNFKVDTSASSYRLDIYRMGYYGGLGARKIATVQPTDVRNQPACPEDTTTGLISCSNWAVSASWTVPSNAVSGIYFAHLVSNAGGESHIVFVVRDDTGASDLLFQTSDTTWQAYNAYGGNSLYQGNPAGRAYKVSYDRPFTTRDDADEDWVFNAEYPMVRWLERNGYDVSYTTDVDSDRRGAEIFEHRVFLSVGHDEYWSGTQRANVVAARDAGVSLAFFSGNEVFWKTRWENNYRTLVSYKETHAGAKIDPTATWTGTWRDPRPFNPEGPNPENALTGTAFMVNSGTSSIQVPAEDGRMRLWRGTSVATQAAGGVATLGDSTLGYEWDEDLDNGVRPPGLMRLSTTTVDGVDKLQDFGSSYASGTATHHLTLYRDPNGFGRDALVFGAGTVQWSWGLDAVHDRGSSPADGRMQQATANLFADMGVVPATLQGGLSQPACGTDTTPPTSRITSMSGGLIRGTASDTGGRVGGVEVSTNGGTTWHPADGRENWSYVFAGSTPALSRAVDDSGNLEGTPSGSLNPIPCSGSPGGSSGGGGSNGGGGGSGGGSSAGGVRPGGTRTRPRATLTPRKVRVSREGLIRLRFTCPTGMSGCKVLLRLRRNGKTVASRRFVVTGAKPRTVGLYLSRSMRRKLVRARVLRVTAVASATDGAGHRNVTRKQIRLLASRGR
jgi:hypothetical protein